MKKIRGVIAGVSHIILSDILRRVAEQNLNMELINNIDDGDITSQVKRLDVDVVMTSFDSTELPKVCNDLLEEMPDVAVVGLVKDGRRLCICVDDVGPREIIDLIEMAVRGQFKRLE